MREPASARRRSSRVKTRTSCGMVRSCGCFFLDSEPGPGAQPHEGGTRPPAERARLASNVRAVGCYSAAMAEPLISESARALLSYLIAFEERQGRRQFHSAGGYG